MRQGWRRSSRNDDAVPIELRFVDMFMAAVGSIVLISMILATLLHSSHRSIILGEEKQKLKDEEIVKLNSTIDELRKKAERCDATDCMSTVALDIGHGSWYDSEVLERWLRITVAASNCSRWSPQIYLRAIDELVNTKTHKPAGYANPLDISDIGGTRTILLGDQYSPETTRRDGTVDMEFDGVMGGGTRLLYVGLGSISDMGTEKCQVTHRYFGVGINTSSSRQLTRNQPYALLAGVSVSDKGTLVIDFDLDHKDQWRPEIEKVTADQNKILCRRYALQCSITAPGAPAP